MSGVRLIYGVAKSRLVVIAHLSVDVANGVNPAITLPVVGLLVLATIMVSRRAASAARVLPSRGEQTARRQG